MTLGSQERCIAEGHALLTTCRQSALIGQLQRQQRPGGAPGVATSTLFFVLLGLESMRAFACMA